MMNTNHFFALRRENEEQATLSSHEQDGKGETGSFQTAGDAGSASLPRDTPMMYAQVTRNQVAETFTPVTIKRIQDAVSLVEQPVYINNHVTVVACVVSLDAQKTCISLMLDDCTSRISAIYQLNPDQDDPENNFTIQGRTRIKEGVWISVNGIVCFSDGCYEISIIRMRPVLDHNEVVFHQLDTIKTRLLLADQGELEEILRM